MPLPILIAMWRKPYYSLAGVFPPSQDLTWIPSTSGAIETQEPAETADGSRTTFTFASAPKFVLLDGQWRFLNAGYTLDGTVVTFTTDSGEEFAPRSGAHIIAIV